jgi:SSS family solute:Na+ symporter
MRYGSVCRTLYACLSLVMYIFAKISVALYAGGIVLQTFADVDLQAAAVALVLISGLYSPPLHLNPRVCSKSLRFAGTPA